MARVKVGTFNDVEEGQMRKVPVEDKAIAIYKYNGQIYATSNICTHEECYLDENHIIHEDVIECTCHGSQFDFKTGSVILPPAIDSLKTYKVEVLGEDIYVDMVE